MSDCCSSTSCHVRSPDPGYRRILAIALSLNASMFLVEMVASLIAGSVSLQADALDFLGDAANYAVSLTVLSMALPWRAGAALGKGIVMAAFGFWVAGNAIWHAIAGVLPRADLMSGISLLALIVNLSVAALLFRYRSGDSNRVSVWLCTRNDAIANITVIIAAGAVWLTGTHWPDIVVAATIACLGLISAPRIIRQAVTEMQHARYHIAAAE